jgi:hypothetical protein
VRAGLVGLLKLSFLREFYANIKMQITDRGTYTAPVGNFPLVDTFV